MALSSVNWCRVRCLPGDEEQVLFDTVSVVLTRQMLELVRLISECVGYHGKWLVGAGVNRFRGRRRWCSASVFTGNHRCSDGTYEESTGTTWPKSTQHRAP